MSTREPIALEARALSYLALARMSARLRQACAPPQTGLLVTVERMPPAAAAQTANLFRATIPDALVTQLGCELTSRFLRFLGSQPDAGVWVARGAGGRVIGFLVGARDRPAVYARLVRELRLPLALAVLRNAWKPNVLSWFWLALRARLRPPPAAEGPERPRAELLAMGVAEASRGQGIGVQLVNAFEAQLCEWGHTGEYLILTGVHNEPARRLYARLGAREVATVEYRGHQLVEFHKCAAQAQPEAARARPGTDAA